MIQQDHLLGGKQKQIDHNPQEHSPETRFNPLVHRQATFFRTVFWGGMGGNGGRRTPCPGLAGGLGAREDTVTILLGEMIDGDHGEDHPKFVGQFFLDV